MALCFRGCGGRCFSWRIRRDHRSNNKVSHAHDPEPTRRHRHIPRRRCRAGRPRPHRSLRRCAQLGAAGARHRSGDAVPRRSRPGARPVEGQARLLGRSSRGRGRAAVPRLQLRDLRVRGGDEPAHRRPHRHLRPVPVEPPAGRSRGRRGDRGRDRASQPARGRRAPDRGRRDVRAPVARADRDRRPRRASCRRTSSRPASPATPSTPSTSRSSCHSARSPGSACCAGPAPRPLRSRCSSGSPSWAPVSLAASS